MKTENRKAILLLMAVGVAALRAVTGVWAGDYHTGSKLKCTQCHVMHASNQGVTYGTGGATNPSGNPFLLQNPSTTQQCLSCHGSGSLSQVSVAGTAAAPDNNNGQVYPSAYGMSAGIFQSDCLSTTTTVGHNIYIAGPQLTAIQGTWTTQAGGGIQCVDCHDPHGNANYRNLHTQPGTAARPINVYSNTSWTLAGIPDPVTYQVYQGTGSTKWDTGNMAFNAPNNISTWCEGCHTNIEGPQVSSPYNKHPQNHAISEVDDGGTNWINGTNGSPGFQSTNTLPPPSALVAGGTGAQDGIPRLRFAQSGNSYNACGGNPAANPSGTWTQISGTNQVFCLTCHKAHGGQYHQNLVWPNGYSVPGSHTMVAQAFAGCNQCHAKGL